MRIKPLVAIGALALSLSGAALAFDAAAPDDAGTKPSADSGAAARSAKSIECSQKADAQNLHGKPRRHFMHECKHGAYAHSFSHPRSVSTTTGSRRSWLSPNQTSASTSS
jgi:hypothetical protein